MKQFKQNLLFEAYDHAKAGGQALHSHRVILNSAPKCFVRDIRQGKDIGHLFDMDRQRLEATARRLGVRVIKVERIGTHRQHIDLCGTPMAKALTSCV